MLTVRIIDRQGFEFVKEAKSVHFNPEAKGERPEDYQPESLFVFFEGEILPETIECGTVFVMNSNGKTVAKYDINLKPRSNYN